MKKLLLLAVAFYSTSTFGQTPTTKTSKGSESDTSLKVVYQNKESRVNKPAYFLNGNFVSETLLGTINPAQIDNIDVIKDSILIDSIQYYGQVHIKTKSSYDLKLISLTALKNKYTTLKDNSVVFMIDGSIIHADYDKYLVDENYLLKIIVDKFENSKERIDFSIIKLITKSEENIKKSKEIRIRGTDMAFKN